MLDPMPGTARRRRPTMTEVARAAGVSVMTVSYAYSQPDRVSPEVLAKVRETASRLRYPGPHPGARSLRRGRAGSVGVVLGEHLAYAFDDPQAARFLAGVAEVCAGHGLGLMLLPITGAPADVDRVADAAVDGFVVWTTADDDPVVDAVAATGLPAVVHGGPRRDDLAFVAIDELAAAHAVATEAFATARRPAVLSFPLDRARAPGVRWGPPPDVATFRVTRQRLRGMRAAWQDLGGDWSGVQVVVCARNSAAEAERHATELLTGPDVPDAVAAMGDELALGVLRAAAQVGRRVPGDLAVTGWDDSSQAGPAGLTTVAQSLRDQGAHCARLAVGEGPDDPYEPEWSLIRRESSRRGTR
jgi:DNA-binding LacI/PurR family transcriptional regulator